MSFNILTLFFFILKQREDGSVDLTNAIDGLKPLKEEDEVVYEKMKQVFTTCASSGNPHLICSFIYNNMIT